MTGLYFPHHWHLPDRAAFGEYRDAGFDDVRRQLDEYLAGERREFDLPVEAAGSPLQERVWRADQRRSPTGQTVSYGELARELGDGVTAQEVGAAVGRNPVSIIVPCHRVVGADGGLTGYAGGLRRKRTLLDLERDVAGRLGAALLAGPSMKQPFEKVVARARRTRCCASAGCCSAPTTPRTRGRRPSSPRCAPTRTCRRPPTPRRGW